MTHNNYSKYIRAAVFSVFFAAGLSGCAGKEGEITDMEKLITQESRDLVMIQTKNGLKQYLFDTPLMEYFEFAAEPYREFREGIYVETYQDSTNVIESVLKADYALYYEKQELWFASGNVIVESRTDGSTLYTEQLFWNQRTGRIYSYVDGIFVDEYGLPKRISGLESNEQFTDMNFYYLKGAMPVESTPQDRARRPERGETDSEEAAQESTSAPMPDGNRMRTPGPAGSQNSLTPGVIQAPRPETRVVRDANEQQRGGQDNQRANVRTSTTKE